MYDKSQITTTQITLLRKWFKISMRPTVSNARYLLEIPVHGELIFSALLLLLLVTLQDALNIPYVFADATKIRLLLYSIVFDVILNTVYIVVCAKVAKWPKANVGQRLRFVAKSFLLVGIPIRSILVILSTVPLILYHQHLLGPAMTLFVITPLIIFLLTNMGNIIALEAATDMGIGQLLGIMVVIGSVFMIVNFFMLDVIIISIPALPH